MRLLLNLIWLVFGGLVMAFGYAVVAFILIITIPFGIASARIALFCLWPFGPFGREIIDLDRARRLGSSRLGDGGGRTTRTHVRGCPPLITCSTSKRTPGTPLSRPGIAAAEPGSPHWGDAVDAVPACNRPNQPRRKLMRGVGRATFAAVLLLLAGTVNVVYGIGALGNANIFHNGQRLVFSDLNTMGWVLIILGIIQLLGGFSLISGNTFGRVIAIVGASLGAIAALFSISGPNPWWSLAVFFLCIYVIHGIFIYGDDATDLSR